jgi:hypothetical protein
VEAWEKRASELSADFQRWLIKTSARNMRDDLGDQVKRAIRGPRTSNTEDAWATATTEPPDALEQAPECAWCPICRAARRMAQAQAAAAAQASAKPSPSTAKSSSGTTRPGPAARDGAGVPAWYGAADALLGAARDALSGLDAILSYRPPEAGTHSNQDSSDQGSSDQDASDQDASDRGDGAEESEHGPDHRG